MKKLLFLIFFIPLVSFGQTKNNPFVNSIKRYIDITSPLFSGRYITTPDGLDMKYTEYLLNQIDDQKGNNYIKALASFSSILANLSKESAKEYADETGNTEQVITEYQKYLFLITENINDRYDDINLYLNTSRSVSFHLKVQGVEVYKELENKINNISKYIDENFTQNQIITDNTAYSHILFYCHLTFIESLKDYALYLTITAEKDFSDFPFSELAQRKDKIIMNFRNLPNDLDDSSYLVELKLSNNKLTKIIEEYFFIINSNMAVLFDYEKAISN